MCKRTNCAICNHYSLLLFGKIGFSPLSVLKFVKFTLNEFFIIVARCNDGEVLDSNHSAIKDQR